MIKKMMTAPCSLNTEPYLTEWHADLESGMEIWIQVSKDEENPKWQRLGNLLEKLWIKDSNWSLHDQLEDLLDRYSISPTTP